MPDKQRFGSAKVTTIRQGGLQTTSKSIQPQDTDITKSNMSAKAPISCCRSCPYHERQLGADRDLNNDAQLSQPSCFLLKSLINWPARYRTTLQAVGGRPTTES